MVASTLADVLGIGGFLTPAVAEETDESSRTTASESTSTPPSIVAFSSHDGTAAASARESVGSALAREIPCAPIDDEASGA
jgi:hypothetical protein